MAGRSIKSLISLAIIGFALVFAYQNCQQGGSSLAGLGSIGPGGGGGFVIDPSYLEVQIGDGGQNPLPINSATSPVAFNYSCNPSGLMNIRVSGVFRRGTAQTTAISTCSETTGQGSISFGMPGSTAQTGSLSLTIQGTDDEGDNHSAADSVTLSFQVNVDPPPPPPPPRSISVYNVSSQGQDLRVEFIAKGYTAAENYNIEIAWSEGSRSGIQIQFNSNQEPRGSFAIPNTSGVMPGIWARPQSITVRETVRNLSDTKQYVPPQSGQESAYYMAEIGSCRVMGGNLEIYVQFAENVLNNFPLPSTLRSGFLEYRNISTNGPWRTVNFSNWTLDGDSARVMTLPASTQDLSNLGSDTILFRLSETVPYTGPFFGAYFQNGQCGR